MNTNIFVKFLPSYFNDTDLNELFSPYGTILSAKVMIDNHSGNSLGFGFVRFSKEKEAMKAVENLNGYKMGPKTLMCKFADHFSFPDPSPNMYVKPLPLGTTEGELQHLFAKYGPISTVKIVADVGNVDDSVIGFVKYENINSAALAIEAMNGCKLFPGLPNLLVKYAESDMQRATRKANTHPPSKPFSSLVKNKNIHNDNIDNSNIDNSNIDNSNIDNSNNSNNSINSNEQKYYPYYVYSSPMHTSTTITTTYIDHNNNNVYYTQEYQPVVYELAYVPVPYYPQSPPTTNYQ